MYITYSLNNLTKVNHYIKMDVNSFQFYLAILIWKEFNFGIGIQSGTGCRLRTAAVEMICSYWNITLVLSFVFKTQIKHSTHCWHTVISNEYLHFKNGFKKVQFKYISLILYLVCQICIKLFSELVGNCLSDKYLRLKNSKMCAQPLYKSMV